MSNRTKIETRVTVNEVADFFIRRARETGEPITNLKIQKLTYYAQAWYLALNDEPLVKARFEAWVHGPVSRDLYNRFREYAWKPIDEDVVEPTLPDAVRDHLKDVWEVYGGFSALDLERLTHEEDPWLNARQGLAADAYCDATISEDDMKAYYRKRLDEANTASEST